MPRSWAVSKLSLGWQRSDVGCLEGSYLEPINFWLGNPDESLISKGGSKLIEGTQG